MTRIGENNKLVVKPLEEEIEQLKDRLAKADKELVQLRQLEKF
jgi:uncharacterized protein involved in exopolysaccharide biosynthesis